MSPPGSSRRARAAAHLRGAVGAQRLVQRILLVAEAAADIGLDDMDIRPRAAQCLSHYPADDMGDLGGGHHHDPAVLLIGEAAVVLDMAVLHGGGIVPALHLEQSRLLYGGLIIALAHIRVLQDIVGIVLVELGCAVLHGLLHIQHEGQLLILHLQRPHALHGGHLVLRDDHRHIVAPIPHMAVEQMAVGHVLMAGIHGPRVARRGEHDVRHIEAGDDLHHARDGLGSAGIHRLHKAVGDLRVLDAHIQRVLGHQILVILGASCGLVKGVHPDLALSYLTHSDTPPCKRDLTR